MKDVYHPIAQHLQQFCEPGEFVIWRDAFRWKKHIEDDPWLNDEDHEDEVLSNHYDSMELGQLCEEFGYVIAYEYNLKHVAIVRKL